MNTSEASVRALNALCVIQEHYLLLTHEHSLRSCPCLLALTSFELVLRSHSLASLVHAHFATDDIKLPLNRPLFVGTDTL